MQLNSLVSLLHTDVTVAVVQNAYNIIFKALLCTQKDHPCLPAIR